MNDVLIAESTCRGTTRTSGLPSPRMRALVTTGASAALRTSIPVPRPLPNEVLIEVHAAGLCRTDLYVVSGEIDAKNSVIPGHEFSGVIRSVGQNVQTCHSGQRVAVNPLIRCGRCVECARGRLDDCRETTFLGIDRDGAFADLVAVPASAVVQIPDNLPWEVAAFAEPVAASLAVLKADIQPEQRGLIFGDNRIAHLTLRVLRAAGFTDVTVCSADEAGDLPPSQFDFIVETLATTESLARMVQLVQPRGRIVLKSRQYRPVKLVLREILHKEPIFAAVNYGRFERAIEWLANGTIGVDDLIGNRFGLEDYQRAFDEAWAGEQRKTFLIPQED